MPLPLGHSAIGLTAYSFSISRISTASKIKLLFFIVVLANLPDIDVIFGLLLEGNGNIYHRGPTHSLLFSIVLGYLASKSHKLSSYIPKADFAFCFIMIFSHVLADLFFTSAPVSLLWPLEVNFSVGESSFGDILNTIIFQCLQDIGILIGCGIILLIKRAAKHIPVMSKIPTTSGQ